MKKTALKFIYPLNISERLSMPCCHKMAEAFADQRFTSRLFCYQARNLFETNVLLLWGSFSLTYTKKIQDSLSHFPKNRLLIHIRGCDERLDNNCASSSLVNLLPINIVHSSCTLDRAEIKQLLKEARLCLLV